MNDYSLEIQADGCDEKGNDLWKLVVIDRADLATNLLPNCLLVAISAWLVSRGTPIDEAGKIAMEQILAAGKTRSDEWAATE